MSDDKTPAFSVTPIKVRNPENSKELIDGVAIALTRTRFEIQCTLAEWEELNRQFCNGKFSPKKLFPQSAAPLKKR